MRKNYPVSSASVGWRLLTLLILLGGGLLVVAIDAPAQAVMTSTGEPATTTPAHSMPGQVQQIDINPALLGEKRIELDIGEQILVAIRDRVESYRDEHLTWVGHIEGASEHSEVVLTLVKNKLSGQITINGRLYEISTSENGEAIVFEVNRQDLPPDFQYDAPASVYDQANLTNGSPRTAQDGPVLVDTMVLYTSRSCDRYGRDSDGGCSGVEAKILSAVAAANQAYRNSQINAELNLVHMDEVDYRESGDMGLSLYELQRRGDGRLDDVHSLRDSVGADVVSLISEDSNACGVGYVMTQLSSGFDAFAFNVVYSSCMSSQTLAHEIGHNMGSQHDRDSSSFGGVRSFSYGYRSCGNNGFTTVMAYRCAGSSGRSHFSNPNVRFSDGRATGTATENNARSINESVATVAAWRASTNSGNGGSGNGGGNGGSNGGGNGGTTEPPEAQPPAAPDNMTASARSTSRITLGWRDNSDDEDGFHLDRAVGNSSFTRIANLGANATGGTNNGLAAETTYRYRIRAFNGQGVSAWSNIAAATTAAPTTSGSAPAAPEDLRFRVRRKALVLKWQDRSDDETGFRVIRNNTVVATLPANAWRYRDFDIQRGRQYSYRVEAFNASGAASSGTVAATARSGSDQLTLSARKRHHGDRTKVVLVWSGASDEQIKVFRNGKKISRTANDGRFVNMRNKKGSWTYKICDLTKTWCSNAVTVTRR